MAVYGSQNFQVRGLVEGQVVLRKGGGLATHTTTTTASTITATSSTADMASMAMITCASAGSIPQQLSVKGGTGVSEDNLVIGLRHHWLLIQAFTQRGVKRYNYVHGLCAHA